MIQHLSVACSEVLAVRAILSMPSWHPMLRAAVICRCIHWHEVLSAHLVLLRVIVTILCDGQ